MSRAKSPVKYWKNGKYYYYKTPEMSCFRTTCQTSKARAQEYVKELMEKKMVGKANPLFKDYAEPYFDWERCPHATRLRAEGKHITERYCNNNRRLLEKYFFGSELGRIHIADIRRGDILRFRDKLLNNKVSKNVINSTIRTISVILGEAVYREDIPYNPAEKVGKMVTDNKEAGVFKAQELGMLFIHPELSLAWETPSDYICFLIAALTGMRKSEILCLKWGNIRFDNNIIYVKEAWKDDCNHVVGLPKSYKPRTVILCDFLKERLQQFRGYTKFSGEADLVVCNMDGTPYSLWHWQRAFNRAISAIGITKEEKEFRHLKPHSFRHTLNTLLLEKGESPEVIRAMTGWSNPQMQRNYTHYDAARMVNQGKVIDAILIEGTEENHKES